jgi:hypothetical protein
VAVEKDHVNWEAHAECVNHVATRNQHQLPRRKAIALEQAPRPFASGFGHETLPRDIAAADSNSFHASVDKVIPDLSDLSDLSDPTDPTDR